MISEIHELIPKLSEQKIWKILLTIKARHKKYWKIWLSRLEHVRFWTSERQIWYIIEVLISFWAMEKIWMVKAFSNWFKCNVYKLWQWFVKELEEVRSWIKKSFKYINPTEYVKANFKYKIKYNNIKFEINWINYVISLYWKYKWVILDTINRKIVSPLDL